ncbi:MAG: 23S rRNA (guanosine(2251)-2'-O)-methyltransferase RlmB [Acidimicrobiales bacterium]
MSPGRSGAAGGSGGGRGRGRPGAARGGTPPTGSPRGGGRKGGPDQGKGRKGTRSPAGAARTSTQGARSLGRPDGRRTPASPGLGGGQVEGRQAVRELLSANRRAVTSLLMAEGMDAATILDEIEALASARRVRVEYVSRRRIDSVARTEAAQGVVALARPVEETPLESLCGPSRRGRVPFLLVLDGITDPHNLGSLLRSAECAGVTGIVLPRHRSAHLSPTVAKVAAGAIEYLPMALVAGVPTALQKLAQLGVWTVGLVAEAERALYSLALGDQPVALVLGSEGAGLAPLSRKRCEALASIPQHGTLPSLNVATAGAIACFDVARQRVS